MPTPLELERFFALFLVELSDESIAAGDLQRAVRATMRAWIEQDEITSDPLGSFVQSLAKEWVTFLQDNSCVGGSVDG